jgi:integrase
MSPHQVYNVLDTCRTMFNWARTPEINLLPSHFPIPFADDLVGQPAKRDPLKPAAFPLNKRVAMVEVMDEWQVIHLAWSLVLPLRPEDFQGLLIEEVDRESHLLRFGERLGGADFNKGRQQFVCPYPQELAWLLDRCIGPRSAGPLLRRRDVFSGRRRTAVQVATSTDVTRAMEAAIANTRSGDLQAPQDFKRVVRRSIVALGGVSTNCLRKELRQVFERAGFGGGATPYELRHSINSEFERAGVGILTHRYVTGHATNDVLNHYTTLAPASEMQKYFATLHPLFDALHTRAEQLSMVEPDDDDA